MTIYVCKNCGSKHHYDTRKHDDGKGCRGCGGVKTRKESGK